MELSVVIPVYNGEKSLAALVDKLIEILLPVISFEIILVNDCSQDNSWQETVQLKRKFPDHICAINLARNYGEHNAVMAGYRNAKGDFIVNIDDDFQNPPEEILALLHAVKQHKDVVYSYYEDKKHHWFRNFGSLINDKVANIMLKKPKDLYLSSFRIISKRLLKEIILYDGPYPYIDGLILQSTSKIGRLQVNHLPRRDGESNYTFTKLLRLWSFMFFNFSVKPLRISIISGLLFALLGGIGSIFVVVEKILYPDVQVGWGSLMLAVLILSGIQLLILGIMGEYVGRIFISHNRSPQYSIFEILSRES